MRRSTLMIAATIASGSTGVALAGPSGTNMIAPQAQISPVGRISPTPRYTPGVVARCIVDPAVRSLTLTKVGGAKNKIQATIVVVNNGRDTWRSGGNQQNVSLTLRNGNTGRVYTVTRPLPASAAPGAVMLRFTTPVLSEPFDTFEFSGTAVVQIGYDPDIAIDGNTCNDDANGGNNRKQLVASDIQAFLGNAMASRTW